MTFNDYQKKAHTTALYLDKLKKNFILTSELEKILSISYVGLGLGEVGETQNKIKKILRDSGGVITEEMKNNIEKELGDILWYIAELCTLLDVKLEDVAFDNIKKLFSRKDRGVIVGSGDNR